MDTYDAESPLLASSRTGARVTARCSGFGPIWFAGVLENRHISGNVHVRWLDGQYSLVPPEWVSAVDTDVGFSEYDADTSPPPTFPASLPLHLPVSLPLTILKRARAVTDPRFQSGHGDIKVRLTLLESSNLPTPSSTRPHIYEKSVFFVALNCSLLL